MKELYFTSPYRRSLRTIRLEYGQVKKKFVLRPMTEKSTVKGNLRTIQKKKYLTMNKKY